jgi:3-phenylpropionate/trans-cinnamate dioxygenase ferredoxin reductase subunit
MAPQIGSVLVAGASVSRLHVAERLRAAGYTGTIALVGAEKHLPYVRPPLSKQVLVGTNPAADLTFRSRDELDGLDVALHLGLPATGWDGATLSLADGSTLTGDRLVIATGVQPRLLPGQPEHPAVGTLRSRDDESTVLALLEERN